MSELKARKFFEAVPLSKEGFYQPGAFVNGYLKSEVDKVIADKDKEISELQAMLEERNRQIGNLDAIAKRNQIAAQTLRKKMNHQKYKRCLDRAEMCQAKYDEEDAKVNGHYSSWEYTSKEMKYWERWSNRWLELAENFREAK